MSLPATTLGRQLERLVAGRVDFVLIGGLAVGAWGYVRTTNDVDIVVDRSGENLERVTDVLRSGDITLVETELGRVGIVQGVPYVPSYPEAAAESEAAVIDGVEVRVCSLRQLVEMKRAAGRPQDEADIDGLRDVYPDLDLDG